MPSTLMSRRKNPSRPHLPYVLRRGHLETPADGVRPGQVHVPAVMVPNAIAPIGHRQAFTYKRRKILSERRQRKSLNDST
jgi:hypothetical protein